MTSEVGNSDQFPCNVCKKVLKTKNDFHEHLLNHTGNPFLWVENFYEEHLHLNTETVYRCKRCMKEYDSITGLKEHYFTHTETRKSYKCDKCSKCFMKQSELKQHSKVHSVEKPYKCHLCTQRFGYFSNLTVHFRVHGIQEPFKCNFCKETFWNKIAYEKHVLNHTKGKVYRCKQCKKEYDTCKALKEHYFTHICKSRPKLFKCDKCDKRYSNSNNLELHSRTHKKDQSQHPKSDNRTFKCGKCNMSFSKELDLNRHYTIEHEIQLSYTCTFDQCDIIYACFSDLENHVRDNHAIEAPVENVINPDEIRVLNKENETKYNCDKCQKGFTYSQILKLLYQSAGNRKYKCDQCVDGVVSLRMPNTANVASDYGIKMIHWCPICNKPYSNYFGFKKHLYTYIDQKSVSTENCMTYNCHSCEKSFLDDASLESHLSTHEMQAQSNSRDEVNISHICRVCKQSFLDIIHLTKHLQTHLANLPYECDVCSKTFETSNDFNSHVAALHATKSDFNCHICNTHFPFLIDFDEYHVLFTHKGTKLYKCNECDKSFVFSYSLRVHSLCHVSTLFACQKCKRTFVHAASFLNHICVLQID